MTKADDSAGNNDYDLNDLIAQIPDRNRQQTGETESDTRVTDILGLSDDDLMDMIASKMRGEEVTEDAPVTQDAPVVTSAVETEVEPLDVGGRECADVGTRFLHRRNSTICAECHQSYGRVRINTNPAVTVWQRQQKSMTGYFIGHAFLNLFSPESQWKKISTQEP